MKREYKHLKKNVSATDKYFNDEGAEVCAAEQQNKNIPRLSRPRKLTTELVIS